MGPILLIEGSQDIRDVLTEILVTEGYQVLHGPWEPEALRRFVDGLEALPSLVLLDQAPLDAGASCLCHSIREHSSLAAVPILAMTTSHHIQPQERHCRAHPWLPKPFDLCKFLDLVAQHATRPLAC